MAIITKGKRAFISGEKGACYQSKETINRDENGYFLHLKINNYKKGKGTFITKENENLSE